LEGDVMSFPLSNPFKLTTLVEAAGPVVHVIGEVDVATAPALLHELLALTDRGFSDLIVDLSQLTFIDAAGLGALVVAMRGIHQAGGDLTLRSPPPLAQLILERTGIAQLLRIEDGGDVTAPLVRSVLGAEERVGDRSAAVLLRDVDVSADLARAGALPASHAVVDAALRLVTALAVETVVGADGVSVCLERHGQLQTVAASNETVARMDGHQYVTDEGPCLAASRAGHWFHIEALSKETRWPAFVPRAMGEGIASILSTPLLAASRPVGALNIYSNQESAFGPRQQELAALFASQASGILEDAGVSIGEDEVATRLLRALEAREVIAQAKGILMARRHVTAEQASNTLQRHSRAQAIPLLAEAEHVIASTQLALDDAAPADPDHG
jgi:anti-anti-sigma factor